MKYRFTVLVATFACLTLAWPARSQTQPDPRSDPKAQAPEETQKPPRPAATDVPEEQPAPRRMTGTWQDGLVFESEDGDYRVQFGAFLRFDGRFVGDEDDVGVPNTWLIRTLRATFQGRIAKYFGFKVQPDFTGTGPTVADAWVDIAFSDHLHLRFGRDKTPIGLEVLLQDANVLFLERGLPVNLLPQRDVGAQAYGTFSNGTVSYAVGLFDGQVDGAANNQNTLDTDNAKDFTGRIFAQPFGHVSTKALQRLGVGLGGSAGRREGAPLAQFRTSVQQVYFAYRRDAFGDGTKFRLEPQASYYYHTVGMYAEYVKSREGVTRGIDHTDVNYNAWQLVGSFLLTGETAGERIRPKYPFDPERHHFGALQLTARFGRLSVDPAVFALDLAEPASSRESQVVTVGANWYFTTNAKMLLNYERSIFDRNGDGARPPENAVLLRMQLNY